MVMSEHEVQTWAVSSTSQRQPSTYSPGFVSAGIFSTSTTEMANGRSPEQRFVLPCGISKGKRRWFFSLAFHVSSETMIFIKTGSGQTDGKFAHRHGYGIARRFKLPRAARWHARRPICLQRGRGGGRWRGGGLCKMNASFLR